MTAARLQLELLEHAVESGGGTDRFELSAQGLTIQAGEFVALVGQSGSGKTMLVEVLGLLRRTSGAFSYSAFDGQDNLDLAALWGQNSAQVSSVRSRMFGFVPQSGGLFPFLNARENMEAAQIICNMRDPKEIDSLLVELDLVGVANRPPTALSMGQRQRVAIGRALAHKPKFIIADEPTSALDPATTEIVMSLMLNLSHERGLGILMATHDRTDFATTILTLKGTKTSPRNYRSTLIIGGS
jgi:putative ABC transport system ATP-binding protein